MPLRARRKNLLRGREQARRLPGGDRGEKYFLDIGERASRADSEEKSLGDGGKNAADRRGGENSPGQTVGKSTVDILASRE